MKTKSIATAVLAAAILIPPAAYPGDARARAEAACDAHDWPDALAWYEVAGESGDRSAQMIAGLMNLYGDRLYPGIQRDSERAKAWLRRAAAQGSADAGRMLVQLEREPALDPARLIASATGDPPAR